MNEQRLIELEIKTAYQEDLLQALNKIVGEQQLQIQKLERTCQILNERIKSLSNNAGGNNAPVDEMPPHY